MSKSTSSDRFRFIPVPSSMSILIGAIPELLPPVDVTILGLLTTVFATLKTGLGIETMLCPLFTFWPSDGFLIVVEGDEPPLLDNLVLIVDNPSPRADLTSFFVGACDVAARSL